LKLNRQWIVWGLLALAAGVVVYFVDPRTSRLMPPCPLHALTGLYCPGCGSTRALHQLLHGNLAGALHFNPLTVFAVPVLGYLVVGGSTSRVRPVWLWIGLAIILTFGVVRNIPAYPFTVLAP
jgi:hypothetical protein